MLRELGDTPPRFSDKKIETNGTQIPEFKAVATPVVKALPSLPRKKRLKTKKHGGLQALLQQQKEKDHEARSDYNLDLMDLMKTT